MEIDCKFFDMNLSEAAAIGSFVFTQKKTSRLASYFN